MTADTVKSDQIIEGRSLAQMRGLNLLKNAFKSFCSQTFGDGLHKTTRAAALDSTGRQLMRGAKKDRNNGIKERIKFRRQGQEITPDRERTPIEQATTRFFDRRLGRSGPPI